MNYFANASPKGLLMRSKRGRQAPNIKHVMYVTCVIVRDYYVVPNCAGARA